MDAFLRATTVERATLLEPYVYGVNASWWMPCERPPAADTCSSSSSHQGSSMGDLPCFRGVHDGWVQGKQVDDTLELGAALIKSGGDHFDIYDDVSILSDRVPTLVETVRQLLHREYQVANMEPVAFRVSIALPMDAADVPGEKSSKLLSRNINSSVRSLFTVSTPKLTPKRLTHFFAILSELRPLDGGDQGSELGSCLCHRALWHQGDS